MGKKKRLAASVLVFVMMLQTVQGFAAETIDYYTQNFDGATAGMSICSSSERIIDSWGVSNGVENIRYVLVDSKADASTSASSFSIDSISGDEYEIIDDEDEVTKATGSNAEEYDSDSEIVIDDRISVATASAAAVSLETTAVSDDDSDLYVKMVIDHRETQSSGNLSIWRNFASSSYNKDLAIKFDLKVFDNNAGRQLRFRSGSTNSVAHGNLAYISSTGEVTLLDETIEYEAIDDQWHTYTFNLIFDYPEAGSQTISAYIDDHLLASKTYTNITSVNYFDVLQFADENNTEVAELGFDNFKISTISGYVNKKELAATITKAQNAYDDGNGGQIEAGVALLEAINSAQAVYDNENATTELVDEAVLQLLYAIETFRILIVEDTEPFDELREKLVTSFGLALEGESGNDLSDSIVAAEVMSSEDEVAKALQTLITDDDRTQIFSDISPTLESGKFTDAAFISNTMKRIKTLALAYSQPGNRYYHDEELKEVILSAYDFVLTSWYCYGAEQPGNWWYWKISVFKQSMPIFLIMFDEISLEKRVEYIVAYNYFIDEDYDTIQTGANRLDIGSAAARLGVVAYDSDMIEKARAAIEKDLVYVDTVPPGDGFYPDGSFIQHTKVAYTGSYGKELLAQLISYKMDFDGSEWALPGEYDDFIYDIAYNSFAPLIYNGKMMDMVNGRAIVRQYSNITIGYETMDNLYLLSVVSDDDNKEKIQSMLKQWISNDDFYYNADSDSSAISANLRKFMRDSDIEAADKPIYNRVYPAMDRVVHTGLDYAFGLSMFSSRILSFEQTNGENIKGWYTGSGMPMFITMMPISIPTITGMPLICTVCPAPP